MFQFDEHIFQMGWFNHKLDQVPPPLIRKKNKGLKCLYKLYIWTFFFPCIAFCFPAWTYCRASGVWCRAGGLFQGLLWLQSEHFGFSKLQRVEFTRCFSLWCSVHTVDGRNPAPPAPPGIFTISTGAGFLLSTVWWLVCNRGPHLSPENNIGKPWCIWGLPVWLHLQRHWVHSAWMSDMTHLRNPYYPEV